MKSIKKEGMKTRNYQKFCKVIACFICFCFLLSTTAIPVSAKATPVSQNGRLSVKGNKIVNQKGKAFVIKGVSTHGLSWFPQYVNKKAFKNMRDQWGVNTIRLAMYTEGYNGYMTGDANNKKTLKNLIHKGVTYAKELGMYVIIDWHILSDGNPKTYEKESKAFFKEMAKKYKSYNNVLFEICNEPNNVDWNTVKSYANQLVKTIRSVNPKAIIIVGTPTWSQDVDLAVASPVKGSNIAYSFHFYAGTHKQDLRNKLESAVKKGLPVIVTEFGLSDASGNGAIDQKEGNRWLALLNQYKIGRVCWNLSNKAEASALIQSSSQKVNGWNKSDLTAHGKWLIKAYGGTL